MCFYHVVFINWGTYVWLLADISNPVFSFFEGNWFLYLWRARWCFGVNYILYNDNSYLPSIMFQRTMHLQFQAPFLGSSTGKHGVSQIYTCRKTYRRGKFFLEKRYWALPDFTWTGPPGLCTQESFLAMGGEWCAYAILGIVLWSSVCNGGTSTSVYLSWCVGTTPFDEWMIFMHLLLGIYVSVLTDDKSSEL